MPEIIRPPRFHQKVIAQEAPGGPPARVSLVAPTIAAPGEPFALKLAVLDELGFPTVAFDGGVEVAGVGALAFERGGPALAEWAGVSLEEEGFHRFRAELGGETFHSNPVFVTPDPAHRIYWGDPHVHTILSCCHWDRCRSLNFCYAAARHITGLDWVAPADHVSNGRCEVSKWKEQHTVCDAYDDPPAFATLFGYEASLKGGAGGDNNVYLRRPIGIFVDEYEDGNTRTLAEKLVEAAGEGNVFIVPHHTTRTGKHGEISLDIYPGDERMPVVEIHSKWGTSEYRGNPTPLDAVHPGPSYVTDLLAKGLKLGFIAGTDTHNTMPSGYGVDAPHIEHPPGLTAVLAPELSRDAVFDAIRVRRCYAACIERIYLDVALNGLSPGQAVAWDGGARALDVITAGRSDLDNIAVIRNGETIHERAVGDWNGSFSFTDEEDLDAVAFHSEHFGRFVYYYVRVTCVSGARAWSSPVWMLLR
jgi:hypothetical protein